MGTRTVRTRRIRLVSTAVALAASTACGATGPHAGLALPDVAEPIEPTSLPEVAATSSDAAVPVADASAVRPAPRGNDVATHGTVVVEPVTADDAAVRLDPPEPDPVEIDEQPASEQIEQVWLDLAECESNQRWDYNGSSGYDGGLQFHPNTWTSVGGDDFAPFAWQATPVEQVTVAKRLLEVQGWGAWPACSRKLGLR